MQRPSSFNQELYNRLKLIVGVQKDLSKLKEANIEEIGNSILNRQEIINTKEGISLLAQCFNDIADFHPKYIENLADLFIFLQKYKSEYNYITSLGENIVSCLHKRENLRSSFLFFLRMLYIRKAITIESIIDEINMIPPFLSIQNPENKPMNDDDIDENIQNETEESKKLLFFCSHKKFRAVKWFYPEIKNFNNSLLNQMKIEFHLVYPLVFKKFDEETIEKMMNTGYSIEKVAEIIRNDDIDSFIQMVDSSLNDFDLNQTIQSSIFERCSIISHNPNLIQYAAFFNSIKIFKYLFSNNADIEKVNHSKYSLVHFAICGGSIEILHILETKSIELFEGIPISIKYFQNDIFQWLFENRTQNRSEYKISEINNGLIFSDFSQFNFEDEHDDDSELLLRYINNYQGQFFHSNFQQQNEEEEEENDENENNGGFNFKCLDFDSIFQTILESNNYLALFILYNYGMSINIRNKDSKKTLLHFAIQKGKSFIAKLLLSNKFINALLQDYKKESAIVYSVKFSREKIFFLMIKNKKIFDDLTFQDQIMLLHYADINNLDDVLDYLLKNMNIDITYLINYDNIELFCNAIIFLPFYYLNNQLEMSITQSFLNENYDIFCIAVNRALKETKLRINGIFYFSSQKNKKENDIKFNNICFLLKYYFFDNDNFVNDYYKKYKEEEKKLNNFIDYNKYFWFEKGALVFVFNRNCIVIGFDENIKNDKYCSVSIEKVYVGENSKKVVKKKKSSNLPSIIIDDDFI